MPCTKCGSNHTMPASAFSILDKYPIVLTMGAHGWLSYPMNINNNAYAGWI